MSEYIELMNKLRKKADLETKTLYKNITLNYFKVYSNYRSELSRVPPGSLKEAWIKTQMKSLGTAMKEIAETQEVSVMGAMNRVIRDSLSMQESYFNNVAKEAGLPEDLFTGMFTSLNTTVLKELLSGKAYKDGGTLSERVWKRTEEFNSRVEDILSEGLTAKKGYYDIAKELEQYVKPSARKDGKYVPGKKTIDYNAYRLANTMITHSYQTALARVNERNPFIDGIEWVGGHNSRSCKLCKSRNGTIYAAKKSEGRFTTEPLPLDHPNGFCKNIPYISDSLEDIGKRLGKWGRGESDDPELDKWYNKYGKSYGGAKEVKKAVKKAKEEVKETIKEPTKPESDNIRDNAWYDKNFKKIKSQLKPEHWEDIREHIKKAPDFVQDWWARGSKKFKYGGPDGNRAYFSKATGEIRMDMDKEKNNPRNPYTTFFHEFGHLVDNTLSRYGRASTKNKYYEAMLKDVENLKRSVVPEKIWEKNQRHAELMAKKKLSEKLENEKDYISGVSDIMGGITKLEIQGRWGHSLEYWNRFDDPKIDICSEMWAHMSSCYANEDNYRVMKEYFPTALEVFEDMIKKHK